MKINLAYGKNNVELNIPEDRVQIITPTDSSSPKKNKTTEQTLNEALDNPVDVAPLQEASREKKVCCLVEDSTRGQPHAQQIEATARRLKETAFVQYIITTGSHTPQTKENQQIVEFIHDSARRNNLNYDVFIHDCESTNLVKMGKTSRGTEIVAEKCVRDMDLFLIIANMKNHYFAGYCNAIKNFLPGLCSFRTIEQNHKFALEEKSTFGQHPWHPNPQRRENPVSEDMIEAMSIIAAEKPIHVLASIGSKNLTWASFGDIKQVTREGIRIIDETTSFDVEPSKHVIVSPGGYPNDETLYVAQRGLDLVKNAIQDGGEVLLLASCDGGYEGLGPSEKAKKFFYDSLTIERPEGELAADIKKNYRLFKQKAYKLAEIIDRVEKIWLHSELEEEVVQKAHLYPISSPQRIVDEWLRNDPEARIILFEDANKLAVYAK